MRTAIAVMMKRIHVHLAIVLHRNTASLKSFVAASITIRILLDGKTASTDAMNFWNQVRHHCANLAASSKAFRAAFE